jgi:hypothetical protein
VLLAGCRAMAGNKPGDAPTSSTLLLLCCGGWDGHKHVPLRNISCAGTVGPTQGAAAAAVLMRHSSTAQTGPMTRLTRSAAHNVTMTFFLLEEQELQPLDAPRRWPETLTRLIKSANDTTTNEQGRFRRCRTWIQEVNIVDRI